MVRITPCRNLISDRFSVASFVVQVPPERMFEVACATDPSLFRADQRHRRTAQNFATSRVSGLLRAPAGQATYVVPPEQLRRFAGQTRIYYAVGAYRSTAGDGAEFSVAPDAPESVPYIQLSADFTGKTLDRGRLRGAPVDARYGGDAPAQLGWGGDLVAQKRSPPAQTQPRVGTAEPLEYDDGFDGALWQQPAPTHGAVDEGCEDAPDLRRRGGAVRPVTLAGVLDEADEPDRDGRYGRPTRTSPPEPPGFEDAVALRRSHPNYGRPTHSEAREVPHYGGGEPEGFEDGRALRLARRAYGGTCTTCSDTGKVECTSCRGRGCGECEGTGKLACSACAPADRGEGGCPGRRGEGGCPGKRLYASNIPSSTTPNPDPPKRDSGSSGGGEGEGGGEPDGDAPGTPAKHPSDPKRVTFPDGEQFADGGDAGTKGTGSAGLRPDGGDAGTKGTGSAGYAGPRPYTRYSADWDDLSEAPPVRDDRVAPARPLTAADRVRILDGVFATLYGSNLYDHVDVDDDAGLVWGAAGFAQAHGTLGEALAIARRRDPDGFLEIFGPDSDELLQVTRAGTRDARMAAVGGRPLGDRRWRERFRAAGRHGPFCAAQREAADTLFFQPALPFARNLGLDSEPQLAVLFDRCVHMGAPGGCRYLLEHGWPRLTGGELANLRARYGMPAGGRLDAVTAAAIHGERARRGDGPDAAAALSTLIRGRDGDADIARRIARVHHSDRFNKGQRYSV